MPSVGGEYRYFLELHSNGWDQGLADQFLNLMDFRFSMKKNFTQKIKFQY